MNEFNNIMGMYALVASPTLEMSERNKEWRKRLRKEYANLQNLPRKKKKQEKKRILFEWQIACYDPFNMEYTFD